MIRKIKEKDVEPLVQLILDYRKEHSIAIDNPMKNSITSSFLQAIKAKDNLYVITDTNDLPEAFINFNIVNFPLLGGKELYISELFVSEKSRGKGYGTKLLDYAIDYGNQNLCRRVMLNNGKDSEAYLRNFYKNKGFVERDTMANFVLNL